VAKTLGLEGLREDFRSHSEDVERDSEDAEEEGGAEETL
jgi:hypothetical protein